MLIQWFRRGHQNEGTKIHHEASNRGHMQHTGTQEKVWWFLMNVGRVPITETPHQTIKNPGIQAMVKFYPQILSGKSTPGVGISKPFCLQHHFWGHLILFCLSGSGSWAQSFQQTIQDQVVYSQLHFDHTWCGSRVTTSFAQPLKTPQ